MKSLGKLLACIAIPAMAIGGLSTRPSEASERSCIEYGKTPELGVSYDQCRAGDMARILWNATKCSTGGISLEQFGLAVRYERDHPSLFKEAMENWEKATELLTADFRKNPGWSDQQSHDYLCRNNLEGINSN